MKNLLEHFKGEKYISLEELEKKKLQYQSFFFKIQKRKYLLLFPSYRNFYRQYLRLSSLRIENNQTYFLNKKKCLASFFQNINGYPLDDYQIECILKEELSLLVIAGAGSGKSLTILGKISYLIEEMGYREQEILVISFTRESSLHLENQLQKNFGYHLSVLTFHKLALTILKEEEKIIAPNHFLEEVIEEFYYGYVPFISSLFELVSQSFLARKKMTKEEYFHYLESKKGMMLKRKIATFIHLFKANKENREELNVYLKKSTSKEEYLFLLQVYIIYHCYQEELKANGMIDFDDMIWESIQKLKKQTLYFPYRFILIDEFQDTSFLRCRLIQELIRQTGAKLMVVGDDFQSIYRFTGCDLDVFLHFSHYFAFADTSILPNTYRNSQELIDIAGDFIMRNKNQIQKKLYSEKHFIKPIKIVYYENAPQTFLKLLEKIGSKEILVLGRNQKDIESILSSKITKEEKYYYYQNFCFSYQTVHQSKGLESEVVILIHLEDSLLGFPNKIEDDPIFRFLLKEQEPYRYDEERRLFYVALTRTKNEVYLLTPQDDESCFVKELKRNYHHQIEILSIK